MAAKNIDRRNFLKIGIATAGAYALGGQGLRSAEAAKKKKLTFWQPIDNHYDAFEYFGSKVPKFNEKYPDITVDLVEYPFVGFEAKFLSAFAGRRNAPDIFVGLVAPWAGCVGVADPMPGDLVQLCEQARERFAESSEQARQMATNPLGPLPDGMAPADLAAWTVVANVLLNLDEMFMSR